MRLSSLIERSGLRIAFLLLIQTPVISFPNLYKPLHESIRKVSRDFMTAKLRTPKDMSRPDGTVPQHHPCYCGSLVLILSGILSEACKISRQPSRK